MKGLLKFIACGSVDDGKSTLIGHILYDAKLLYADQEKALELDSRAGSRNGKIDYSLLLDGLMAEREQGITIDVAYRYFSTEKRTFIVADTPGHEEYTRNMAVGASFADLAVILVDASQGVLVQTRRHSRICSLMGIRYFVFAVNKMDLVDYSESRFNEITGQIKELSSELGLENIKIIPVSASEGDNVAKRSDNTGWYGGESLLEYLENIDIKPSDEEKGAYMPVQRVCRPDRTFRGFQGQIESGGFSVGDVISVIPGGENAAVKEILVAGKSTLSAHSGQPVTITLDREIDISRGCVIEKASGISAYKKFRVSLLWTDESRLAAGNEYLIKLGTKLISAVVTEILYSVDVNTGEHISVDSISRNEIAECVIIPAEAIPADVFSSHKTMGEFILIDRVTNMTSACGVINEVSEKSSGHSIKASFVKGDLRARGDVFEEFRYDIRSLNVFGYYTAGSSYTVGDEVPVTGESYSYPDDFDILVLRDDICVYIRGKKVADIQPLLDYKYSGKPVVNGRGFGITVDSEDEVKKLLEEYRQTENTDRSDFFRKYMRFDAHRKVIL